MKSAIIFFPLFVSFSLFAQDDTTWKEASKESQAYHKYRQHLSYPSYGYDKINLLIKKQVVTDSDDNLVMKEKTYAALSPREKFTYMMLHGESFNQNCDAMPPILDEQTKIFGYLPEAFDEFTWSDRQTKFLNDNRDSVMAWIKESVSKSNRIGINYKLALEQMNTKEAIPFLISIYNKQQKDYDILTLLMLLMKENKYEPFLNSALYKKFYGENSNYQEFIMASKANKDMIIKQATDFYNGLKN